ncbi:MAG: hypothetical protein M0Z87_04740 [Actinomycetota bacterium]|nr:hypothetical protein [Actinomycetota bacterium]
MSGTGGGSGQGGSGPSRGAGGPSVAEAALDVLVYGPLGLLLAAKEELPKILSGDMGSGELGNLVQRGHRTADQQISSARIVGRFALSQGQAALGRQLGDTLLRMTRLFPNPFGTASPTAATSRSPVQAPTTSSSFGDAGSTGPRNDRSGGTGNTGKEAGAAAVEATGSFEGLGADGSEEDVPLPSGISGYDQLSAMQVVQRLPGLSSSELRAVVEYESATRARRTILTKANQLLNDPKRS